MPLASQLDKAWLIHWVMNDQSAPGELPFRVRVGVAEDEHVHAPPSFHS